MKLFKKHNYGKQYIDWKDIFGVFKVLKSDFLTQGPKVAEFEKAICQYVGARFCVAVSSATAGLHISMKALGIKNDDEVITSPITFLASANCSLYVGANPKFADINPKTACIDPKEIEKNITKKTKVLIPVHFAGQSCDMESIKKIAQKNNLFIIEDAAHAIGSDYKNKKVGSCQHSDMTVFSFHAVKNMTTGEGGAVTTNDENLYKKLLLLRSHGMTKDQDILTKNDGPWYYECHNFGFNYRLTDIQATLGISQIKKIERFKKRRREIIKFYKEYFAGDERFNYLEEEYYSNACFHLFTLLINFDKVELSKKEIFLKLQENNINCQIHYIPVHLQPLYQGIGFKKGDFPKSEEYYEKTISLPVYHSLTNCDIIKIYNIINKIVK